LKNIRASAVPRTAQNGGVPAPQESTGPYLAQQFEITIKTMAKKRKERCGKSFEKLHDARCIESNAATAVDGAKTVCSDCVSFHYVS
jgi:hypothetical protein